MTVLSQGELFAPTSVGDFLTDATLFQDNWRDPLERIAGYAQG